MFLVANPAFCYKVYLKKLFSKATKGASCGRSFLSRKNSFFRHTLSTAIWAKKKSLFRKLKRLLSGWQDSNLRPPAPKAGAITGLRYTPKTIANIKFILV